MDELLDGLYQIRDLAVQHDENEWNLEQLRSRIQKKQNLKEKRKESVIDIGLPKTIFLLIITDFVLVNVAVRIIFYFDRLIWLNQRYGVTDTESAYRYAMSLPLSIGAHPIFFLIGAPFAFLIMLLIKKIIRFVSEIKARKTREDNQSIVKENERIKKSNAEIEKNNQDIMAQIASYEELQAELVNELHDINPEYPEVYFTVSAVDYIIDQLETGKARSIGQAIVHYEARR